MSPTLGSSATRGWRIRARDCGRHRHGSWLPALSNGASMGPKPTSLACSLRPSLPKFADAWRVTDKASLFDYAPGTSTATFTMREWPKDNPPCDRSAKQPVEPFSETVAQERLPAGDGRNRHSDCAFDVRVTGERASPRLICHAALEASSTTTSLTTSDKIRHRSEKGQRSPRWWLRTARRRRAFRPGRCSSPSTARTQESRSWSMPRAVELVPAALGGAGAAHPRLTGPPVAAIERVRSRHSRPCTPSCRRLGVRGPLAVRGPVAPRSPGVRGDALGRPSRRRRASAHTRQVGAGTADRGDRDRRPGEPREGRRGRLHPRRRARRDRDREHPRDAPAHRPESTCGWSPT